MGREWSAVRAGKGGPRHRARLSEHARLAVSLKTGTKKNNGVKCPKALRKAMDGGSFHHESTVHRRDVFLWEMLLSPKWGRGDSHCFRRQ